MVAFSKLTSSQLYFISLFVNRASLFCIYDSQKTQCLIGKNKKRVKKIQPKLAKIEVD